MEEREHQRTQQAWRIAEAQGDRALTALNEAMIAIRAQDQWIREQVRQMERNASS